MPGRSCCLLSLYYENVAYEMFDDKVITLRLSFIDDSLSKLPIFHLWRDSAEMVLCEVGATLIRAIP